MTKQILAATTSQDFTDTVTITYQQQLPTSLSAGGLGPGEFVTLQYFDGTIFRDFYADGEVTPKRITDTNSMVTIYAPGQWRGDKGVTASPVSVNLHSVGSS